MVLQTVVVHIVFTVIHTQQTFIYLLYISTVCVCNHHQKKRAAESVRKMRKFHQWKKRETFFWLKNDFLIAFYFSLWNYSLDIYLQFHKQRQKKREIFSAIYREEKRTFFLSFNGSILCFCLFVSICFMLSNPPLPLAGFSHSSIDCYILFFYFTDCCRQTDWFFHSAFFIVYFLLFWRCINFNSFPSITEIDH